MTNNPIWDSVAQEMGNPLNKKPEEPSKRDRHKAKKAAQELTDQVWEEIANGSD